MPPQLEVTVAPESKAVVSRVDRDRALVEARRRREPSAADDLLATYGDRACRLAPASPATLRTPRRLSRMRSGA
jgi:hypothetical protein